ncbi:nuclear transport factor 2 family protein [Mucilaginibacter jinjuensis]|uniref:Nuclear transport factor 2 family protein n=1 Tax=Mucilaginibacter jinjuensis TaxID=1176721 RepID=A0ABY7T0P2_9SPHI|nr:nuclear transport factor 2 family protein [Mucilaginibacter jinjuensis]WCT09911.1 nuclear transport factor 2 family protein [Mucilaginibacter jinjuensis]
MNTDKDLAINIVSDDEKQSIANQFLLALRNKNWDSLASIITPDATWALPGENLLSGIAIGGEEFIKRAKTLVNSGVSLQLKNIQLSYSGFALSVHNQTAKSDAELDVHVAIVATLRGDKIAAIRSYVSDLPNMNGFFDGKLLHEEQLEMERPSFEQKWAAANTFLTAMKTNNWELMQSVMIPDIEWTLPGKSLLSGPAIGVDAIIKRAQSLKKFGVMFELLHILNGWDSVALSLHNTGKRGELILDEYVTIVFQLNGDKITGLTTHLSDVPGIERFFVPGIID